jgi:hypothetical protein
MVTTRARARVEHAEEALRITVHLIMVHLQPADMKSLRLACTSVRPAVDQAAELLEVSSTDLELFSKSSFRPSRLYIVGRPGDEDEDDPQVAPVLPQLAWHLEHIFKLRLTGCAGSSALRQVLQSSVPAP